MKNVIATMLGMVAGFAFLTACGQPAPGSPTDSTPGPVSSLYEYGDDQSVKVVEINGRVCYLYDGYESGGIWCES
jgi:hypothetical protein